MRWLLNTSGMESTMVVSFKDGTRLNVPNGAQAHNFLQFDLPWLVYVHGEVTCMKMKNAEPSFTVQLPADAQSDACRC